jgi:hypothetical protein
MHLPSLSPSASTVGSAPRALRALLVVAAVTGCDPGTGPGGDGGPPTPGTMTYRLDSPNGAEGALLVRLPAAAVVSVTEDEDIFTDVVSRTVDDVVYVAVLHRFGSEELGFELEIADTGDPPPVTLMQVVGPDSRQRQLTGYTLGVIP